jgi:hypothetical protein
MVYKQVLYFVSHSLQLSPNTVLVDMAMNFQVTKTTEFNDWLKRWTRLISPCLTYINFRISMVYYTLRSESRCALRLRYVDLVVSIEGAVEVCCCFTVRVFSC